MDKKILVSDLSYGEEEVNAAISVIKSEWMTMGPLTNKFEESFRHYINAPYTIAVSSATAALHLSVMAANFKSGDEIITTPISFVASSNCILYERCRPIFADIDPNTWNIDPEQVRKQITPKIKGIVAVHLAGLPAAIDEIQEICEENNLVFIEDAAHAVGSVYNGKHAGTFGNFGCFSFFSSKNLSTGEGGMIAVKDEKIAEDLLIRRSHGLTKSTWSRYISNEHNEDKLYDMIELGYNYRIGEVQAAIGLEQLKKIDNTNSKRNSIYEYYMKRLEEENLAKYFQFQAISKNVTHAHHIFPVILKTGNRKLFRDFLAQQNIGTSIHYSSIPSFSYYQSLGYDFNAYPNAKYYSDRTITLPMHQKLSFADVDYIILTIKKFFTQNKL